MSLLELVQQGYIIPARRINEPVAKAGRKAKEISPSSGSGWELTTYSVYIPTQELGV